MMIGKYTDADALGMELLDSAIDALCIEGKKFETGREIRYELLRDCKEQFSALLY